MWEKNTTVLDTVSDNKKLPLYNDNVKAYYLDTIFWHSVWNKSFMLNRLHLFDQNTVKYYITKTVKCFYNLKAVFYFKMFLNVIYFCDGKAEFSAVITPVFSVT